MHVTKYVVFNSIYLLPPNEFIQYTVKCIDCMYTLNALFRVKLSPKCINVNNIIRPFFMLIITLYIKYCLELV